MTWMMLLSEQPWGDSVAPANWSEKGRGTKMATAESYHLDPHMAKRKINKELLYYC